LEWSVNAGAIDRARILRAWTRRDLAQQSHVDQGTLCDLFAGHRRPITDVIEFSAAGPKRVDLGANAADGSRAALL